MSNEPEVLWSPRSTANKKTGNVPTAWVGASREESLESCKGCPLLDNRNCYAQFGSAAMGHGHMIRANAEGTDYSLEHALEYRSRDAKIIRLAALGEPGRMSLLWWRNVHKRAANPPGIRFGKGFRRDFTAKPLEVVAYIHNWQSRPDLAGMAMASCDTLAQVDQARALGFRATVVLPRSHVGRDFKTPDGATGIVCPAQQSGGAVTCNDCKLCAPKRNGPVIGFIDHGPQNRVRKPFVVPNKHDVIGLVALLKSSPEPRTSKAIQPVTRLSMRVLRKMLSRLEKHGIIARHRSRAAGRGRPGDAWYYVKSATIKVGRSVVDASLL